MSNTTLTYTDDRIQTGGLIGNTDLPILSNPTIRSRIRRNDADGIRPFPYYTGLNGLTLIVGYGQYGGTNFTITVTFTSDGYLDAINSINAAGTTHFQAIDDGGFLTLVGQSAGQKSYIDISGGTGVSTLGFVVPPAPGSSSFAGDIASSPAGTNQSNPQTTGLLAHDEDLTTKSVNRAIMSMFQLADSLYQDLSREITVNQTIQVVLGAPQSYFTLDPSPDIRIDVATLQTQIVTNNTPTKACVITDSLGNIVYDNSAGTTRAVISSVTYGTLVNAGLPSVAWGTPDGKNLLTAVPTRLKVGSTAITGILGNVITATGAQFQTNKVQVHDIVRITGATNTTPFDHSGEYVVINVLDEDNVVVRPLGSNEDLISSDLRTRDLNRNLPGGTNYGNLSVFVGNYVRTGMKGTGGNDHMVFNLNVTIGAGTYNVTLPTGSSLRECGTSGLTSRVFSIDPQIAYKNLANVFKALNNFNVGIRLGDDIVDITGSAVARITTGIAPDTASLFTLAEKSEIIGAGGTTTSRRYYKVTSPTSGSYLVMTVNCYWDQTLSGGTGLWSKDHAGTDASKLELFNDSLKLSFRITDGTWPDSSGWDAGDYTVGVTGLVATEIAPGIASGASISIAYPISHITGVATIDNINLAASVSSIFATKGCQITLIPDGLWSISGVGNVALAVTAVVGKALILTFDPNTNKWYPSYT